MTEDQRVRGLVPRSQGLQRTHSAEAAAVAHRDGYQAGQWGDPVDRNPFEPASVLWTAWRLGWLQGTAWRVENLPSAVGNLTQGATAERRSEARRLGYLARRKGMGRGETPPFASYRLTSAWHEGWDRAERGGDPPLGPARTPEETRAAVAEVLGRTPSTDPAYRESEGEAEREDERQAERAREAWTGIGQYMPARFTPPRPPARPAADPGPDRADETGETGETEDH